MKKEEIGRSRCSVTASFSIRKDKKSLARVECVCSAVIMLGVSPRREDSGVYDYSESLSTKTSEFEIKSLEKPNDRNDEASHSWPTRFRGGPKGQLILYGLPVPGSFRTL